MVFLQHLLFLTSLPRRHFEPLHSAGVTVTQLPNATKGALPTISVFRGAVGYNKKMEDPSENEPAVTQVL